MASHEKKVSLNPTISIKIPPASDADDATLTSALAQIVNKVYGDAERDMFLSGYQRTSADEIAQFIRDGQLGIAYRSPGNEPIGCIYIKLLSPSRGEFGMLAIQPGYQKFGLGRGLTSFAEDECKRRGCTTLQLELLWPTTFLHQSKAWLHDWYQRLGYKMVKLGSFNEEYPKLAEILAGPTDYRVYEKDLSNPRPERDS